jgi:cell division topological specificity factor
MFDFFNKLFNPSPPSGATAKERLRLVLLSDHLALAPDVIDALKRDLLAVISRYVEIDGAHADVTFEHREGEVAMLASIPITGVRDRGRMEPPLPVAPPPELATAERGAGDLRSEASSEVQAAVSNAVSDAGEPALTVAASEVQAKAPPRRRRRRKSAAAKRAAQQAIAFGTTAQA